MGNAFKKRDTGKSGTVCEQKGDGFFLCSKWTLDSLCAQQTHETSIESQCHRNCLGVAHELGMQAESTSNSN